MNIQHLKYFVDAATHKSMTKAADIHRVSRPAISHAILKLEEDLGTELIVHKKRTFELTLNGQLLFERAYKIFDEILSAKSDLKQSNKDFSGEFLIGCARTLATYKLPDILQKLRKKYPSISIKIVIANSETLVEKLDSRTIDIAFYLGDETLHRAKETIIEKGSFVLLAPKGHKGPKVSFATTDRRPERERARTLFLRQFGYEMPIFAEVPSWDAIANWVNSGTCGGLIPKFLISQDEQLKKAEVVISKVFPYEIKTLHIENERTHAIVRDFIYFCQQQRP